MVRALIFELLIFAATRAAMGEAAAGMCLRVWHDGAVSLPQYHRAGHAQRWRAVLEIAVAIVLWGVLVAVALRAVDSAFGVTTVKDLAPGPHAYVTLVELALLGVASVLAALVTGRSPARLLAVTGRIRWRWLGTCLLVGLGCHLLGPVLEAIGLIQHPEHFIGIEAFAPRLALVLLLVPLQALGEELFFRGTLMQAIGSFARSPWPAVIISSVLFALGHGLRPEVVIAIGIGGLCAAWLTIRTGGLEAALGHHVMLNTLGHAMKVASGRLKPGVNDGVHWLGSAYSIVVVLAYTAVVARLARRLPPGSEQVEQNAPERSASVPQES